MKKVNKIIKNGVTYNITDEAAQSSIDTISETLNNLEIPDSTSDLTNDSGFITSDDIPQFRTINGNAITGDTTNIVIEGGGGKTYTAGTNIDITDDVISVTGITVPTKTSDLTNDSNFISTIDIHTQKIAAGDNIEFDSTSDTITFNANLSNYYTKDEVDALIESLRQLITNT